MSDQVTQSNERLICTKERPYNKDKADPKDPGKDHT